ncbi:MAG: thermonuclease family protein [Patescibacteria group bacterium]
MSRKQVRKKKLKIPSKSFLTKFGVPLALIPGIIIASMLGFDYEKLLKTSPRNNPEIYGTKVRLVEAQDGDTVQLEKGMPIRLVGIDAPEKGKPLFNESRALLMELIEDKVVEVEYVQKQNDNYGRLRGYLFVSCDYLNQKYCEDGKLNVNVVLVGNGMAIMKIEKSFVKLKPDYSKELGEAEEEAKGKKLGVWSLVDLE